MRKQTAQEVFDVAFTEFGLPWTLRTDNGTPFSATHGISELTVWWIQLGTSTMKSDRTRRCPTSHRLAATNHHHGVTPPSLSNLSTATTSSDALFLVDDTGLMGRAPAPRATYGQPRDERQSGQREDVGGTSLDQPHRVYDTEEY